MRRVIFILLAIGLAWTAGLVAFIAGLPAPAGEDGATADGVVVYTGGGARIAAGMSLMQRGAGRRLLISGVNPDISRDEIAKMWPGAAETFDCCVDLGAAARSTEGNAQEVSEWAAAHGFRSLILVTSEYHMPRALLETHARMKSAEIAPHPVASGYLDARGRPASTEAWRRLAVEYSKFLAARVKTLVVV
ncbi:YdcF family protein [Amphiplicatus metriothermophilus]|uniref:Uncharacterized SAM-binding protein YcdF, DUF218 family n=1 Tax=Amphiplicatus metriothermophilus TaxID=1519374 RepID=A0A239PIW5_9PROT|nr:YdcF family protein [Amphiplicatus metriothermophilus]MBB5517914.1 uncharacterized SAM-binding protein YcdF (DUF218 family) [Amphiplicatus metriothermophilus]SNT67752.1 Uncharacterized SAM-binding protein YcdF, DUF218 family [Amphiplicatus metriothermophilus]